MIINVLQELGLAKNEARIYETLLREGECGVSTISAKAEINRRNVYDSLNRLIEKGLIFEIRSATENSYRAVDPQKLRELLSEKQRKLNNVFAEMEELYKNKPRADEVFIYKGVEGLKNYLRDALRVGEDMYTIGGNGALTDPKLKVFMEHFFTETATKDIHFNVLFNHEARKADWLNVFPRLQSRFLPKEYTTTSTIDIFGDHVVLLPNVRLGGFDELSSFTVIVNQQIADAFRVWFKFMWSVSKEK